MPAPDYDIIIVGGGVSGATLATVMAQVGSRVLLLEREKQFRDRVRGEFVQPWGLVELDRLGTYGVLRDAGANELPFLATGSGRRPPRDMPATTVPKRPYLAFFHPSAQEALLSAARGAGAEVHRGVSVRTLQPGSPPSVRMERHGAADEISARLVVAANGRSSGARQALGGSEEERDRGRLLTGALLDGVDAPEDQALIATNPRAGQVGYIFPQGGGRARIYAGYRADTHDRMQGEGDLGRLIDAAVQAGAPAAALARATLSGPLATFEATDHWVDHPFRDGLALIGDAAGVSDPTWGQGLSLGFRDVRVLRDALLATEDWDAAGHAYAEAHDRYFHTMLDVLSWFTEFFLSVGPEAEARRERARPLAREDPSRVPDHPASGPDFPADETVRRRFFGEE